MSSPGRIRMAYRRRIPGGATTGASGNSDDGATIADGAGKIGVVGISGIEVVGDDDRNATLLLYLVLQKWEMVNSLMDQPLTMNEYTPAGEATAAAPTSGATGTSTEIEPIRITREKEDPTLSNDTSEEIEITEAAITSTSKSLYKSSLYQTMPMRAMQEKYRCKV
ncbi:hypothetical protein Tco_0709378 [Tanacetum coccineum]